MSEIQELARLVSRIEESCGRVTVKKNKMRMLGTKSSELVSMLDEASQSRLWSNLLEDLLRESVVLMKKILEHIQTWSTWNSFNQWRRKSDIGESVRGFHRELDNNLAVMRYMSRTRIFPRPSSAVGTRAQELFRRVLIYTSVVNRFLELRHRASSPGSTQSEEQDSTKLPTEVPSEEALGTERSGDGQSLMAQSAIDEQKVLFNALLTELAGILKSRPRRTALQKLKNEHAQLLIDFLYSVLLQPLENPRAPWFRKHTLIVLRKLSGASMLYPRLCVLKDIEYGPLQDGGGFCDIYKGRLDTLELCLKVVRPQGQLDRMLKIYAKEAILWGQLHHPNVAPFYGIFYFNGTRDLVCLVSPWMNNGNIVVYLRRNAAVPRKPLIRDIASGLKYLHDENVVHADLKGLNILVNDSGRACITDFGISTIWTDKTLGFAHTTGDVIARSVRWTAPELLQEGMTHSRTSDIWAFGCICYEILLRKLPFHECNLDTQIILKLVSRGLPAQRDDLGLDASDIIDDDMWELMSSCWSFEPGERLTCKQICQQLELEESTDGEGADEAQAIFVQESRNLQIIVGRNSNFEIDLVKVGEVFAQL